MGVHGSPRVWVSRIHPGSPGSRISKFPSERSSRGTGCLNSPELTRTCSTICSRAWVSRIPPRIPRIPRIPQVLQSMGVQDSPKHGCPGFPRIPQDSQDLQKNSRGSGCGNFAVGTQGDFAIKGHSAWPKSTKRPALRSNRSSACIRRRIHPSRSRVYNDHLEYDDILSD